MAGLCLRRLPVMVALTALAAGGAWSVAMESANAAPTNRYVATENSHATDMNNDCASSTTPCKTIQHAVDEAASGNTIHIGAGTYPESVLDSSGDGVADLTFVGAGASETKVTGTATGNVSDNFGFDFQGYTATLRDLAVTNVTKSSSAGSAGVGVVSGYDGAPPTSLTLDDVSVSGNADDGVLAYNVAIAATGSHFDDNDGSQSTGDGVEFYGCGVVALSGSAAITTSTASFNEICGVAVIADFVLGDVESRAAAGTTAGALMFTRSTAADNGQFGIGDEGDPAGQVYDSTVTGNHGAALAVQTSAVSVVHSTITDTKLLAGAETTQGQGAIDVFATETSNVVSAAKVKKATRAFARRASAFRSARLRRDATTPTSSMVTVSGSIVADNAVPDCSQAVTDDDYNISSDAANSCGFSSAKHSQTKTNPKLGTLGDHGGATETQLPLKNSPAIDAEPDGNPGCSDAARDQRGVLRPQPTGGRCDIGSVELAGEQLTISPSSLPHGTVGVAYKQTLTASGGQYPTYTWALAKGTLPPGITFENGVFSGTPTEAGSFTVTVSVNDPVYRTYTIVIDAAAASPSASSSPADAAGTGAKLADTGVPTLAIAALGALLTAVGLWALYVAGLIGTGGRHRRAAG